MKKDRNRKTNDNSKIKDDQDEATECLNDMFDEMGIPEVLQDEDWGDR